VVVSLRAPWRVGNPRYSAARPSRNQIVLVLVPVLDCPFSDYEDDDEDEDEKFARPATIRKDTDRLGSLRYGLSPMHPICPFFRAADAPGKELYTSRRQN